MPNFTLTHEIHCDEPTFWRLFMDNGFSEELYSRGLSFPEFSVLELRDGERETYRKLAAMPKVDMPGAIKKLFGSGFRYTEEGTFDKAARVWRWKMTPGTMADKLRNEGTMRVEPAGHDRVRRIADLTVEAKVFGIGGMLEGFAEKNLREGWENSAVFMNRYLAERRAT